ncbi:MAG: hypothetical protein ACXQTO_05155 [Candidatus Syntropharchaeales archaeon]
MRGERIQVRNFEDVGSLLKSEKDCLCFERAVGACHASFSITSARTYRIG